MGLILTVLGFVIGGAGWFMLLSGMIGFNGIANLQMLSVVQTAISTGVVLFVGGIIRLGIDNIISLNSSEGANVSSRPKQDDLSVDDDQKAHLLLNKMEAAGRGFVP